MEAKEEGDWLLEIGKDEVEDQEEVLIVARISTIVFSPRNHAVGDEADKAEGA